MDQDELPEWKPMPSLPEPDIFDEPIIVRHRYGFDAVRFWNGTWKFWYTGEALNKKELNDILKNGTHYMRCPK